MLNWKLTKMQLKILRIAIFLKFFIILFHCNNIQKDNSNFGFLTYLSRIRNSSVSLEDNFTYPQKDYTLAASIATSPITPTITGSLANFRVNPPLPSGLLIDSSNGTISGIPAQPQVSATYNITATGKIKTL